VAWPSPTHTLASPTFRLQFVEKRVFERSIVDLNWDKHLAVLYGTSQVGLNEASLEKLDYQMPF
jgi:hypothetical protein